MKTGPIKSWDTILLVIIFSFFSQMSFAQTSSLALNSVEEPYDFSLGKNWDYSASFGARNFPLGAGIGGQLGYSHLLWGTQAADSVVYGYIRPSLGATTSGGVNRGSTKVEISPIAPLVFSTGYQLSFLNSELDTIDCKSASCSHYLTKQINSVAAVAGVLPWFLKVELIHENQVASIKDRQFADPDSSLLGLSGGQDKLISQEVTLGMIMNDRWTAGVQFARNQFQESQTKNTIQSFFVRRSEAKNSWIGGAGTYESSFARSQAFGFLAFEWSFGKSLALM